MRSMGILAVSAILLFSSWKCNSPESSEDVMEANIIVINTSGTTVDIYLDGVFRFSVNNDASATLEKITLGVHQFQAKLKDSSTVVQEVEFDLDQSGDYEWTILGPSQLTISNSYGETLQIYSNGDYVGDIADASDITVGNVPFGTFLLEATRQSDGSVVASLSIVIDEIKEYFWTISK
jgi:hypothetical protein